MGLVSTRKRQAPPAGPSDSCEPGLQEASDTISIQKIKRIPVIFYKIQQLYEYTLCTGCALFPVLKMQKLLYACRKMATIIHEGKLELACANIPGFQEFYDRFRKKLILGGLATATIRNYSGALAATAIRVNCPPDQLNHDQIEEYLFQLTVEYNGVYSSQFKMTVCALRKMYVLQGRHSEWFRLPSLRRNVFLPVILSKEEMSRMLNLHHPMRNRLILALLYECGLRSSEVRNLRLEDVDLNRKTLFVRQAKGRSDRYIPFGNCLLDLLKAYLKYYRPKTWLFRGRNAFLEPGVDGLPVSKRSVHALVKQSAQRAGIVKNMNVHSLRHTFATHLLEDGVDLLSVKELMGHRNIKSTLIYLKVARPAHTIRHSLLEHLDHLNLLKGTQLQFSFANN